jgi:phage terminase large subunit-like protein
VRYFEPATARQAAALRCRAQGLLIVGGNRSGKTVLGAAETVYRHLGEHPHKPTHAPPIRSWCISQQLPGGTDKPHVQLEEVRRWAPQDALRGGSWAAAYSPGSRTLHWANGGVTEFKSYDQDPLAFESWKGHWIWFDEEPTRREIYTSCLLRLVDYAGQWAMTLTPILSLTGASWVEELWSRRGEPDLDYECHQLLTLENPHLDAALTERTLRGLSEEERLVRSQGAFARVGGRVLSELEPRHYVAPFLPPREWRHYLVIDPGYRNPGAALWAAVDEGGRIWLYAEHYERGWLPRQHVAVLHGLWEAFGRPEIDVLMDPAGFAIKRTSTGAESPSDWQEYVTAATELGAEWLFPRRANNGDPLALRVKRFLVSDQLRIGEHLRWLRWEAERWTYQRQRQGLAAAEQATPEGPVDRDNHLMDCLRYLCNEEPDPLPQEPVWHRPGSAERHWQEERERLAAAERPPVD